MTEYRLLRLIYAEINFCLCRLIPRVVDVTTEWRGIGNLMVHINGLLGVVVHVHGYMFKVRREPILKTKMNT